MDQESTALASIQKTWTRFMLASKAVLDWTLSAGNRPRCKMFIVLRDKICRRRAVGGAYLLSHLISRKRPKTPLRMSIETAPNTWSSMATTACRGTCEDCTDCTHSGALLNVFWSTTAQAQAAQQASVKAEERKVKPKIRRVENAQL